MQASPPMKLDFATFSSLLRVINTSPPWDETSLALERLTTMGAKGKAYDTRALDEQSVRGFARLLRADSELIFRAILCGAYAGRLVNSPSRAERIIRGLLAIKEAYRFEDVGEVGVSESLDTILTAAVEFYGMPMPVKALPLTSPAEVTGWLGALNDALRIISVQAPRGVGATLASEGQARLDVSRIQSDAWRSTLHRLSSQLDRRQDRVPGNLQELMCHAAGIAPSTVIGLRLDSMGIVAWSDALRRAVQRRSGPELERVPFAIAPIALRALGFALSGEFLEQMKTARLVAGDDEIEMARPFILGRTRSTARPMPSVLIIRRTTDSLVAPWRPSHGVSSIALPYEELSSFPLKEFFSPTEPPAAPPPSLIAIELTAYEGIAQAKQALPIQFQEGRDIPAVVFTASTPTQRTDLPCVVEPRSVEDLVNRGLQLAASSSNVQA